MERLTNLTRAVMAVPKSDVQKKKVIVKRRKPKHA
jgi:hypothetical protein